MTNRVGRTSGRCLPGGPVTLLQNDDRFSKRGRNAPLFLGSGTTALRQAQGKRLPARRRNDLFWQVDETNGMSGDSFAMADGANPLIRGRFEAHLVRSYPKLIRNICPHPFDVGRHARGLGDDHRVDVGQAGIPLCKARRDRTEQNQAGDVFPFRIMVGKMMSQVAQPRRPQQGIADGVKQNVGVGMAGESQWMGNIDTADHAATPRFQPMYVISGADSQHRLFLMRAFRFRLGGALPTCNAGFQPVLSCHPSVESRMPTLQPQEMFLIKPKTLWPTPIPNLPL